MKYRMIITGKNVPADFNDAISEFTVTSPEKFTRIVDDTCARKGWAVTRIVREPSRVTYVVDTQGTAF